MCKHNRKKKCVNIAVPSESIVSDFFSGDFVAVRAAAGFETIKRMLVLAREMPSSLMGHTLPKDHNDQGRSIFLTLSWNEM
jgi:hypothetical protein